MVGGAAWVSFPNVSGWCCHLVGNSHALGRGTEALWGEAF